MNKKRIGDRFIELSNQEMNRFYPDDITPMFAWMDDILTVQKPVIFDIGANIGLFSLSYASLYQESEIYAFEPVPFIHNILQGNIERNSEISRNISPINLGLSNQEELKYLSMPTSNQHERYKDNINIGLYSALGEGKEKYSSSFITLDNFFESNSLSSLDFIKIDVEGYEYNVLEGGKEILTSFKPLIIFELNEMTLKLSGRSPQEYIDFAKNLNYDVYGLQYGWKKDLLPIKKTEDIDGVSDIVLIHKDK